MAASNTSTATFTGPAALAAVVEVVGLDVLVVDEVGATVAPSARGAAVVDVDELPDVAVCVIVETVAPDATAGTEELVVVFVAEPAAVVVVVDVVAVVGLVGGEEPACVQEPGADVDVLAPGCAADAPRPGGVAGASFALGFRNADTGISERTAGRTSTEPTAATNTGVDPTRVRREPTVPSARAGIGNVTTAGFPGGMTTAAADDGRCCGAGIPTTGSATTGGGSAGTFELSCAETRGAATHITANNPARTANTPARRTMPNPSLCELRPAL